MSSADPVHQDPAGPVHDPDASSRSSCWAGTTCGCPAWSASGSTSCTPSCRRSGGLYATANVTYRGTTIGKVTDVEPTENGARATMSIDDRYKIPVDAMANVHSVSAIGEQYLDLVSTGNPGQYFSDGTDHHQGHGAQRGRPGAGRGQPRPGGAAQGEDRRAARPKRRRPWADLGPALQRLVDGTTRRSPGDFKDNIAAGQRHHRQLGADPATARSTPVTRSRSGRAT